MSDSTPYGTREVIQCNCGQVFAQRVDLNDHINKNIDDLTRWPSGNVGHGNLTLHVPKTEREWQREQDEIDALQRRGGRR